MTRKHSTILLWAVICAAQCSFAAEEALPKADAILDRYVEVTGGKAAHLKIKNTVMVGTFNVPAQNIKATTSFTIAEPNKRYMETEFPGIGKFEEGSNGDVAWSRSAMMGPHIKEGEERDVALQSEALQRDVLWRDYFTKVQMAGLETLEGRPCYKIILTPKVGRPETRYYDKATGLLTKGQMVAKTQMGDIDTEMVFSDYKEVGGIKAPRRITSKAARREIEITFDEVKYNQPIPESVFKLPADVQALADKKTGVKAESTSDPKTESK